MNLKKSLLALTAVLLSCFAVKASGWPAQFQGVMLQGFYWDSQKETSWANLEAQADELSSYFKLIWVPNSAKAASGSYSMGYDPVYWFTNHNSAFGTEKQIRSLIATFKAKGTGIIEDVVINHRSGKSNWWDFPAESWNGTTYQIKDKCITANDEVWSASDAGARSCPQSYKGTYDEGEDFNGSRDLDHTSANVQENCKAYCKFLLEDMGYAGFRLDMVKGYSGYYTKMYNQYAKPTYSVGEYWDGQYDAVKAWIESTGRESAAFDFPGKYAINEAFANSDMTKLVWKANGTTDQPAGLIHFGYARYAVTFVDNHDTYRDGSKFASDKVEAANAFIIMSPGTPCVFWPHWTAHKSAIKKMIEVRNACGINNESSVNVIQSSRDCYMAEITGTKGKAVVKIGSSMASPSGYTSSDIRATGDWYCIWSKTSGGGGGGGGGDTPIGEKITIYYDNSVTAWSSVNCYSFAGNQPNGTPWPGDAMTKTSEANIWSAQVPAGSSVVFNGTGGQTVDVLNVQDKHLYKGTSAKDSQDHNQVTDAGEYTGGGGGGGVTAPSQLYILGNIEGKQWTPDSGVEMTRQGDTFVANNVKFVTSSPTETNVYFNLTDALGADWDALNMAANRYGAASEGVMLTSGSPAPITAYLNNVDASGCLSWALAPGTYNIVADFAAMTVTVTDVNSGVSVVESLESAPIYYNLQGQRVVNPTQGIYIKVTGTKATKVHF